MIFSLPCPFYLCACVFVCACFAGKHKIYHTAIIWQTCNNLSWLCGQKAKSWLCQCELQKYNWFIWGRVLNKIHGKDTSFLEILQQRITFQFLFQTHDEFTYLLILLFHINIDWMFINPAFVFLIPHCCSYQEHLKFMQSFWQVSLRSAFVQNNIANFAWNLTHIFRAINLCREPSEYIP